MIGGAKILFSAFICMINIEGIFSTDGDDLFADIWENVFPKNSQNLMAKSMADKKVGNTQKFMGKQKKTDEKQIKFDEKRVKIEENEGGTAAEEAKVRNALKMLKIVKNEPIFDEENQFDEKSGQNFQKIQTNSKFKQTKNWPIKNFEPKTEKYEEEFDKMNGEILDETAEKEEQKPPNNSKRKKGKAERVADGNSSEIEYEEKSNWTNFKCSQKQTNFDEKEILKIIKEFDKMREKQKNKNIYNWKQLKQIEREIARELGTKYHRIRDWKRDFGLVKRAKKEDKETKLALIEQFDRTKNEWKMKKGYKNAERAKIECEIAKELGINRDKIYKWKSELFSPPTKKFSMQQRMEIIDTFDKIKDQFVKKFNFKPTIEIEEKIAEKFGISRQSIYLWKKNFGLRICQKHKYTEAEKLELIEKFDEAKRKNPTINDQELEKMLPVKISTIKQWKRGTKRRKIVKL